MNLGEYITILRDLDPNIKLKCGLGNGHCWEQNPSELEFKFINDITINEMLKHAKLINNSYITASSNDHEYLMNEFTTIHINNVSDQCLLTKLMDLIGNNYINTEKQKINEFNTFVENIKEERHIEILTSQNTNINDFLYPKEEKTNIISKELWEKIKIKAQYNLDNIKINYDNCKTALKTYHKLISSVSKNYQLCNNEELNLQFSNEINNFQKFNIKDSPMVKHWQAIVDGGIPSGYILEGEE